MTEHLTLSNTVKLGQTKSKEPQSMSNTIPNLTIIYCSETTDERNRTDDDKHNP